ncbi:MAG: argininosuccinate synthase [Deltaproteobacteria bacterium]|nr:argininosuccinate synthase [Deltaproteobacteria bacterium]
MKNKIKKVVVAYSGGLDTSVIIRWLKEHYQCEVVAYVADVGQGGEELHALEEKALKTGASAFYVKDLRKEFVQDFVFPMLRANAVYEGNYLLGTSIARPIIAKGQMEIVQEVGADAVAHGATGKGNDQVRFELTCYGMDPNIQVIAPWREWEFKSRTDLIEYAKKYKIPVTATVKKPYSMDRNIVHISYEGGILEDPWAEPPADMFRLTTDPAKAPDPPGHVEIGYENGNPVSLNGKRLDSVALLEQLNEIAGKHGVGRADLVENRFVGMKSRGVYETPGVTVLHQAHRAVESLTLDREVLHLRDSLIPKYAELVYNGFWFSPEREFLQAAIDHAQKDVVGVARIKLYKGSATVVGRKSPNSLFRSDLATFEKDTVYNQKDAEGFIKLQALRLRIRALRDQKGKKQ